MTNTVVFHLVRASNAVSCLARFVESYVRFPAGAKHRLVFLLKGFDQDLPPAVRKILDSVPHGSIRCPDIGYDVGSYLFGADNVSESIVMFTNSYSLLVIEDWLSKLLNAYERPNMGVVGATGSWESRTTHYLRKSFSNERDHGGRLASLSRGLAYLALFPRFPNVHLRTNAFLLTRRDYLSLRPMRMRTRMDAVMFESGRWSLSRKLMARGLQSAVVGKNGDIYSPEQWRTSRTFWQSDQANILVHDNRTLAYDRAGIEARQALERSAWYGSSPA